MDHETLARTVRTLWDDEVLPSLSEMITIPAVSQSFDPEWAANGHLAAVVEHMRRWLSTRDLPNAVIDVVQLPERTPLLVVEVPASEGAQHTGTALLYGHLDKQPPVGGWSEGLDPWRPVRRDRKLFGRGVADDGYSGYAATVALEALLAAGGTHGRCVLLLETGEESGSPDLAEYLKHLRERLGAVSLVVCLDSGTGDYDRMWLTTSLRGLLQVDVTAKVLELGQHSGMAGGIVPSSFRVLRVLLDRIEDAATGEVRLSELSVEVPADRIEEMRETAATAPGMAKAAFPWVQGMRAVTDDEVELLVNGTWRPSLSVIGADGLPAPVDAGNVLRPYTTLALSFRLPPTASGEKALAAVRAALTTDVPYGATVELSRIEAADGWNAPEPAPWLRSALDEVSERVFGAPWRAMGIGGSIPFMGLLAEAYPQAQFVITGVLGPDSNAHVPDESLDVPYATQLTEAIAHLLAAHADVAD